MSVPKTEWFIRSGSTESGPFTEQQIRQRLNFGDFEAGDQLRTGTSEWVDVSIVKVRFQELDGNGWYVQTKDGATLGPFTAERLSQEIKTGRLSKTAMVRQGKSGEWSTLQDAAKRTKIAQAENAKTTQLAMPADRAKPAPGSNQLPPVPKAGNAASNNIPMHPTSQMTPAMLVTLGLTVGAIFMLVIAAVATYLFDKPEAPALAQANPAPQVEQVEQVEPGQARPSLEPRGASNETEAKVDDDGVPVPGDPVPAEPLPAASVGVVPEIQSDPTRYAFLVGVRNYDKRELTSLKYTEKDVTDLAATLQTVGFDKQNIVLMTQTVGADEARFLPESERIRRELDLLLNTVHSGDSVLIAFSGHGVQFEDDPKNYFCPMDAKLADPNSLIALTEVYEALNESKATTKFMLVDACRNDPESTLAKSVRRVNLEPVFNRKPEVPSGGIIALFSCSATEQSFEDPGLENGIFLHYVNQGLNGKADTDNDLQVSIPELFQFVSKSVPARVRTEIGDKQTPELRGEFRGLTVIAELAGGPKSDASPIPSPIPSPAPLEVTPKSITNSIGMKLNLIPAGTFMMGSPASEADRINDETQHRVTLTKDFYLGTTEVTQGQWESVMGTAPWKGLRNVQEGSNNAATHVSWGDAVEFCQKLSAKDGMTYRLPTESEWEYACRGGTTTTFSFGADAAQLSEYGWWGGLVGHGNSHAEQYAHAVGQKRANPFGLNDMHGNVYEWCSDLYGDYPIGKATDPQGASVGTRRVFRGGSWSLNAMSCRSASRKSGTPDIRGNVFGFRVALGL